jgi:hypothetical protein
MQKYHRVPGLQEVLCGCGAAGSGAEVVDESNGLALQGNGGPAGGYEDDAAVEGGVCVDEGPRERGVGWEGCGGGVDGEVVVFDGVDWGWVCGGGERGREGGGHCCSLERGWDGLRGGEGGSMGWFGGGGGDFMRDGFYISYGYLRFFGLGLTSLAHSSELEMFG